LRKQRVSKDGPHDPSRPSSFETLRCDAPQDKGGANHQFAQEQKHPLIHEQSISSPRAKRQLAPEQNASSPMSKTPAQS